MAAECRVQFLNAGDSAAATEAALAKATTLPLQYQHLPILIMRVSTRVMATIYSLRRIAGEALTEVAFQV